jgi:hypothetical protein
MSINLTKGVIFLGIVTAAIYGLYRIGALTSVLNLLKF